VGVVVVDERPAEIYIGLLELLPGWQGRGLGAAIVGELRERARASGRALTLHVLPVNARAVAFYERCGLRVIASEPTRLAMRAEA
jgi:ribosomal protein S18 acetylase RimI-like enzyme